MYVTGIQSSVLGVVMRESWRDDEASMARAKRGRATISDMGHVPEVWFTRSACTVFRCKFVALHRIGQLRDIISTLMVEANTAHARIAPHDYF